MLRSTCGSNIGMEMSAPLVDGIVNNALFHSKLHINQISDILVQKSFQF